MATDQVQDLKGDHMAQTTSGALNMRARRSLAHTRAIRLAIALADYRCPECRAALPRVYHTEGRIRYVRCRHCAATGKITV